MQATVVSKVETKGAQRKAIAAIEPWAPEYRRVLVPLDGSRLAESILPMVVTLATSLGLEIVLMHVVVAGGVQRRPVVPSQKRAMERIEGYLEDLTSGLRRFGLMAGWRVTCGDPVEEIVRYAAEGPVDFIAMSTHGTGGQSASPMGTVAGTVLERVTRPVLMIKPDEWLAHV
ncbi:MAG: universal stress protein [Chloroflexi bacterium]|nr:universal stress protein [Chloroflexota bacterium]